MTAPLAHLADAARARHLAAPANSDARKAAGCALVVLREARTVKAALRMLAASTLPDELRENVADLIHQLDSKTKETP
ncbi:hypothetical protein KIK06_23510 [Nocardiopsis sp. EMB25]|uniref:hypothetical protein n=1 Tax=Nocardiopsis sp. EMB25 TaxID=2835867 RepID=UPI002284A098|nr:hypothetical protein [Nocardiopsis sp. EMB25]MCY9786855.1 hypothetical protein [Nocardiopsis sp. EMB25]